MDGYFANRGEASPAAASWGLIAHLCRELDLRVVRSRPGSRSDRRARKGEYARAAVVYRRSLMADNLYAGSSVQVFAEPGLEGPEHTHEDAIGIFSTTSRSSTSPTSALLMATSRSGALTPSSTTRRGGGAPTRSRSITTRVARRHRRPWRLRGADGQCLGDADVGLLRRDAPRRSEAPVPLSQYVRVRLRYGRRRPVADVERGQPRDPHGLRLWQHVAGLVGLRAELLPDLEHRRVLQPGVAGREPRSDVQPDRELDSLWRDGRRGAGSALERAALLRRACAGRLVLVAVGRHLSRRRSRGSRRDRCAGSPAPLPGGTLARRAAATTRGHVRCPDRFGAGG